MATVLVAAWRAGKYGQASAAPVLRGAPRAVQSITSSASNQVSTVTARPGEVLVVSTSGGGVKLAYAEGANPDATAAAHLILGAGQSVPVEADEGDLRVSVVDA